MPKLDEVKNLKLEFGPLFHDTKDVGLVIYHWNGSYLKTLDRAVDALGKDIWKHAIFSLGNNHKAEQQLRQVLEKKSVPLDAFNKIPAVFDNEYELRQACLTCCKDRCTKSMFNILRIDPHES